MQINIFTQTTNAQRMLIFLFIAKISEVAAQSIGIGTTMPNNSSVLDVQSSNKAVLLPRIKSS